MIVPVPKVGPELKSASPSQIKEYRLCPRKHWLNKRAGIPQPEGDHLAIGTGAHFGMEGYFETGVLFEPAKLAATYFAKRPKLIPALTTTLNSGLLLLKDPDAPKPKPGLLIETPRNYSTGLKIGGIALRQRSDLLDPTDKSVARSYDWKTAKRVFSDYSKTGEQLAKDEQAICYSKEAFERFRPDGVVFAHGVMGTETIEADIIQTDVLTKEYVDREFDTLGETVKEMREHFAINDFHQTRAKPSADWGSPCRAFKGCPYVEFCGVDLTRSSSTPPPAEGSTTVTISLKERVAAKRAANPAVGINPPDAAKPAEVTPYVPLPSVAAGSPPATPGVTVPVLAGVPELVRDLESVLVRLKAMGPS